MSYHRPLSTLAAAILSGMWGGKRRDSLLASVFEAAADSVHSDFDMQAGFEALAEGCHLMVSIDTRREAALAFEQARNFFKAAGKADFANLADMAREAVLIDLEESALEAALPRLKD